MRKRRIIGAANLPCSSICKLAAVCVAFLVSLVSLAASDSYFVQLSELKARYCHTLDDALIPNDVHISLGFSIGDFYVENNTWGKEDVTEYSQIVFANEDGSELGWTWDWPCEPRLRVRAYPEVIIGKKPWRASATIEGLPVRVSEITTCRLAFSVESISSGVSNMALDIWLTRNEVASPNDIALELMIWLESNGMTPLEEDKRREVQIGDRQVPFYYTEKISHADWPYACFVVGQRDAVDVLAYIRYLLEHGFASEDLYLASIELGNEIMCGSGFTVVRRLELALQLE